MKKSFILLSTSLIITSALLASCKNISKNNNKTKQISEDITGTYTYSKATCNGNTNQNSPYGLESPSNNITYKFEISSNGRFTFEKTISTGIVCKYSEIVDYKMKDGKNVTLTSKSDFIANKDNSPSCPEFSKNSYINSFKLNGEYQYAMSSDKLTLTSTTDAFCVSAEEAGNVVIELKK